MTANPPQTIRLYSYFRSSAAFRARIGLNLKQLPYDLVPVQLLRSEQQSAPFLARNPQALVPVLEVGATTVTQSLAILEYLEEVYPSPPLLPPDAPGRSRVRALSLAIACEIHPINNLRALNFLTDELGIDAVGKLRWYRHWVETGLAALEAMLAVGDTTAGRFCHGDSPTIADCFLVPQIFNAQRFDCRLGHVPTLMAIHERCMELEAFQLAQPSAQPDFERKP